MTSLDDVHSRLRRGDFANDLVSTVETSLPSWIGEREHSKRLKGIYVAAEVFDYFGEYRRAEEVLKDEGPRSVNDLKRVDPSADPEITKRRIWLALAHAVTLYR